MLLVFLFRKRRWLLSNREMARQKRYFVMKSSWIHYEINQKDVVNSSPPQFLPQQANSNGVAATNFQKESSPSSSGTKITPAVLFVIVILAVLFFVSGLLHLLARFLTKKTSSSQSNRNLDDSTSDVLQRQLQQLFNLHDSGLDQAFIDALPVFSYKEIVGPKKRPFDCAVCLCEFTESDKLRLLPTCSHAFHLSCIDTWLLSNSTCPLCRGALFNAGFSIENPIFDYDDFREDDQFPGFDENGVSDTQKRVETRETGTDKGVFPVRLGKFRKLDNVEGEDIGETSCSSKLDGRRCFSMGSYQYVVGDANLRVALNHNRVVGGANKGEEQDCKLSVDEGLASKKIGIGSKTDSYSVSKIWLWSKKGKYAGSSPNERLENPSYPNSDLSWMNRP